MAPQLTIDGRELELSSSAPPAPPAPQEGLFAFEAFAQLSGQRALELEEVEPRSVPCPRCGAGAGSPCKRPSGHTVFAGGVHAPRQRDAERAARGLEPYGQDACSVPAERESAPQDTRERASCSPADPVHRAKMDAGRERAQLERELRGVARVEAFRAWTRAGSPGPCPEVPSDTDWGYALEHGSPAARRKWAS